jgi:hypothetical protein
MLRDLALIGDYRGDNDKARLVMYEALVQQERSRRYRYIDDQLPVPMA